MPRRPSSRSILAKVRVGMPLHEQPIRHCAGTTAIKGLALSVSGPYSLYGDVEVSEHAVIVDVMIKAQA